MSYPLGSVNEFHLEFKAAVLQMLKKYKMKKIIRLTVNTGHVMFSSHMTHQFNMWNCGDFSQPSYNGNIYKNHDTFK